MMECKSNIEDNKSDIEDKMKEIEKITSLANELTREIANSKLKILRVSTSFGQTIVHIDDKTCFDFLRFDKERKEYGSSKESIHHYKIWGNINYVYVEFLHDETIGIVVS